MSFHRVYKGVCILVASGDITRQKVDAIVNPANSMMVMGGGVAGAIRRVGGREIEDEAVQHAPVPVGKAIATKAGRLEAKHVIHAPTMERPAMSIGRENVRLAVKGALECAEQLGIRSVAFPGMGTGVGGLNIEEAARTMIGQIKRHVDRGTSSRQIVLVAFGDDLAQAFEKAINDVL